MPRIQRALADVSLTQLEYVLAVDAERHFGRAAVASGVTQPTLSMQLGKLERTLRTTLFDRSRVPVIPTESGRRVIAQARAILREAGGLEDAVRGESPDVVGEVRLGVIPTIAPYLLPRLIRRLAADHPALSLVVEERVTDDIVARVRTGDLDAALVASDSASAELVERVLFTEPFVAYVSPAHRLASSSSIHPRDLSRDDLWLLSDGHCLRLQAVALCKRRPPRAAKGPQSAKHVPAGCTSAVRFESGNLETIKRLIEQGIGMTLLPLLATAELHTESQRRLVRPFASPGPSRDVRLVRRREQAKQPLIDAVVTAVRASVPKSLL
ncbi:MAG: hydrogen peroxide-inducible genes activator [bacterium]